MSERCLAMITLSPRGGGVAAASRLMWSAISDRWPDDSRLITLVADDGSSPTLSSSTLKRLQFGAKLAKVQALRECPWVFYSHLSVAQVQTYLPSASMQRPYGVFLHGIEAWKEVGAPQRRVLSGASVRIANSKYTAERVRRMHPWIGPIAVCPLALPREDRAPADTEQDCRDLQSPTVIVVGRMDAAERYKGHDELIDAWPHVVKQVPSARLVFVGDGDDARRLKARIDDAGLASSVKLPGFLAARDLSKAYGEASVFAMPSRNEGFGLVYIEAMSHGLPCVGSSDDAARDVIVEGETGFLVAQSDVSALADRLIRLLSNAVLRAAMGASARNRVRSEYSYARFRDQFTSLLTEHLEPRATMVATTASHGR